MAPAFGRRTSCNNRAPDRSAAAGTAVALLAMLHQVAAGIIAAARLERDRLLQNPPDVSEQRAHLVGGQAIDGTPGADARSKQRLVRVEVADAGDDVLLEQKSLDSPSALRKQSAKSAQIE